MALDPRRSLLTLAALSLCIPAAASATTPRARASGPDAHLGSAASDPVLTRDLFVGEDLGHKGDLTLVGIHSYGSLSFGIPETWDVQGQPELHLDLVRSQSLLPDVSSLTVWVDGRPVGTVSLDGAPGEVDTEVIKLPLGETDGYHTVTFLAYHRSRLPCELSDHPGLWSRVLDSSFIHVEYTRKSPEFSLSKWPYPFRDDKDPDPARVVLVLPQSPSEEEVKAAGYVSSLLGASAGWRPLDLYVHQGSLETAPDGHVIVLGRSDRGGALLDLANWMAASPDAEVAQAAQNLKDDRFGEAGMLVLGARPGAPHRALLGVVGLGGEGLVALAQLLTGEESRHLPVGSVEYVNEVKPPSPMEPRRWDDTIPPETTFTLADLGMEDRMATGYRGGVVSIPLNMIPDDHPIAGQARLNLQYSYAAQTDLEHSRIDVFLNGAAAGGAALREIDGKSHASLLLELPVHEMGPESRLDIAFTLVGKEEHRCLGDNRVELWGTVHSDTELKLPRDRWTYVPDLGLARFGGFPMGVVADYATTTFLLRDQPSRTELQLFAWMAAEFGRVSRGDRFAYNVMIGSLDRIKNLDQDIVLVDSGPDGDLIQRLGLLETMSFAPKGTPGVSLALASGGMVALGADPKVAYIEQVALPWNKARMGIVAYAADATLFERVGRCLDGASLFDRLRGRVTRVASCSDVAAIPASERQLLGQKPVREAAYEPIRENYWLLFAGMAIGIFLLLAIRGFYNSLGSRRDYEEDDDVDYGEA